MINIRKAKKSDCSVITSYSIHYTKLYDNNKAAWEEAFDNRDPSWGSDIIVKIKNEEYPFLEKEMVEVIKKIGIANKSVVQFCSNNGRELISVVKNGAEKGVGFDIAENQVKFANDVSSSLEIPCIFHAKNILDIGEEFYESFDIGIITIGALCWFRDLKSYFNIVSKCMKPNGILLINEQHPVANMLGAPGEYNYLENYPLNLCNSYFTKEWIENDGMYYMTKKTYKSKTFTNYTHSRITSYNVCYTKLLRSIHSFVKYELHKFNG